MSRWLLGLVCLTALAAHPASAQLGPSIDEKSTLVEGLVVRAFGGPPWWKVQSGDHTVYVLASPGSVPKDLKFNYKLLDRRIKGANTVIVAPRLTYNSLDPKNVPPLTRLFEEMNAQRQTDDRRALLFSFQRQDPVHRDEQVVNLRVYEKACIAEMPTFRGLQQQLVSDQVAAIEQALKKPGHSVAVLDAGVLLVSGGVLDQLRQKGFTIVTPDVE